MDKVEKVRVLDPVDFHGQDLVVLDCEGEPYVAMKPIVEGMGLAWQSQHRKLTEDGARWGITMMVIPSQGGEQTTVCLPLRKLPGWMMTLQSSRMDAAIADKVRLYQNECDDALWQYWSQGVAVNPRVQQVQRTREDMFLEAAQILVEQRRRQDALEQEQRAIVQEQAQLSERMQAIEERREYAHQALFSLPPPDVKTPVLSTRMKINQAVRQYCEATGDEYSRTWGAIYREVRDRLHLDLAKRAKALKLSTLDYAEQLDAGLFPGLLQQMYAIAYELFTSKLKEQP